MLHHSSSRAIVLSVLIINALPCVCGYQFFTRIPVLYAKPHIAVASNFLFASVIRVTRFGCIQSILSQSANLIAVALETINSEPLTSLSLSFFHCPVLFAWSFLPWPCPSPLSSILSPLERIVSVPIHVSHPHVQPSHPHIHLSLLTPSLAEGLIKCHDLLI